MPTVLLAESYRATRRVQTIDSLLARHQDAIRTRDTDRALALARLVATVAEAGGGLTLTGDPQDLERLAVPYRSTVIEHLR